MEIKSSKLGVKEMSKVVKILGVHFTNNHSLFHKMNFETIEKSLTESLKGWNRRGLTLLGKIQVVQGFSYLGQERFYLIICYLTIGSCVRVQYRVMEHARSLEITKEA